MIYIAKGASSPNCKVSAILVLTYRQEQMTLHKPIGRLVFVYFSPRISKYRSAVPMELFPVCKGIKGIDTYPEDPPAMVPRGSWEPAHLKEPGDTNLSHTLLISVSVGLLTLKVTAHGNPASVLAG
jgi:hypothetical protein